MRKRSRKSKSSRSANAYSNSNPTSSSPKVHPNQTRLRITQCIYRPMRPRIQQQPHRTGRRQTRHHHHQPHRSPPRAQRRHWLWTFTSKKIAECVPRLVCVHNLAVWAVQGRARRDQLELGGRARCTARQGVTGVEGWLFCVMEIIPRTLVRNSGGRRLEC